MSDYGHTAADDEIERLERKYKKVYGEAADEIHKKAVAYFDGFSRRDKEQKRLVDVGELSERDYRNWRVNQMAIGKRWTDFADSIATECASANEIAIALMNKRLPTVYALNHNFAGYTMEHGTGMNLNFELYDRRTVERLMKGNPRLLPAKQLDVPKDKRWNTKKVQSAILQGIIQGEDIDAMADRLQAVTDANRESAVRNVRTCVTGAENAGRLDGFKYAQGLGISMKKEWLATLDDRTRASHALLDGEKVDVDKAFSNGLRYPGDPFGPPSEVYNCRCTMIAAIDDVDEVEPVYRRDNISGERISDMTYKEWFAARTQAASQAAQTAAAATPAVVAVAGKLTRDYSNSIAQSIGQTDYDAMMDIADASTSDDARRMWEAHQGEITVGDAAYRGTPQCYGNTIYFDANVVRNGDSISTPFQTVFHESGHALDNIAGRTAFKGAPYSASYNGGEFQHTIKKEVDAWVDRVNAAEKAEFAANATDYAWLYSHGYISKFDYEWYVNTGVMLSAPKYTKAIAYRKIEEELKALPHIDVADLCDIMGGATMNKVNTVAGHSTKYWRERACGDDWGLAKEAFAEMYDSMMASPGSWATLQKYLPQSCTVFETMIAAIS